MFLNFSKIKLRPDGTPEDATLILQTLTENTIGVIAHAYDVRFSVNLSDLSTVEFTVPYMVDGVVTPLYDQITGYKIVYTEAYGIYVLTRPQISGDGVSETKRVTGYSLEYLREKKRLFLEEGTYNFWDPINRDDTILGRVLEIFSGWSVGYVDPSLTGMYRTFDQYDSDALNFCYKDAMTKFQCVIVFDVYEKTINAYNANESRGNLPIYLSYENLANSVGVTELSDEIVTKLHVCGADDLTIAGVNPAGTDYIIDLSFFIERGDLDFTIGGSSRTLAKVYQDWQRELLNYQEYYTGLVSARVSCMSEKLAYDVQMTELRGELETIKTQQNVSIQAYAMETTDTGKQNREQELADLKAQMTAKQAEIDALQAKIDALILSYDGYSADILAVNNALAIEHYFTDEELLALKEYLIEDDLQEETFVASSVDASASGAVSSIVGTMDVSGSEIVRIDMGDPYDKSMYTFAGGNITVESASLSSDIIRGTLEVRNENKEFVLSLYLGTVSYSDKSFESGLLTVQGIVTSLNDDIV